jgi:hypothetical protein
MLVVTMSIEALCSDSILIKRVSPTVILDGPTNLYVHAPPLLGYKFSCDDDETLLIVRYWILDYPVNIELGPQ